jgi:hypothetical protein
MNGRHSLSWIDDSTPEHELAGIERPITAPLPCGSQCPTCDIFSSALQVIHCYALRCPLVSRNTAPAAKPGLLDLALGRR